MDCDCVGMPEVCYSGASLASALVLVGYLPKQKLRDDLAAYETERDGGALACVVDGNGRNQTQQYSTSVKHVSKA